MTILEQPRSNFRFTGWHMLACMGLFFGTIISVNIFMAILASGTWTGLVVKNSYVASQGFNERLVRSKQQAALGFHSKIEYESGTLRFSVLNRSEEIQSIQEAKIWLGRPAFEQEDRWLLPACDPQGTCKVSAILMPGEWSMVLEANVSGLPYRRNARISVSQTGKIKVE